MRSEPLIREKTGHVEEVIGDDSQGLLPEAFLRWQIDSRLRLANSIHSGKTADVKWMPAHLAVIATINDDGTLNLASKGIGLIPRSNLLERFTEEFTQSIRSCSSAPWESSICDRARALLRLYSEIGNFDRGSLGGLEIFEGGTYQNLKKNPEASLLFTGDAPDFVSFQIDGKVEFVESGDSRFEFLLAARQLFSRDGFHVFQSKYPHGFIIKVEKVRDKRPFTRN